MSKRKRRYGPLPRKAVCSTGPTPMAGPLPPGTIVHYRPSWRVRCHRYVVVGQGQYMYSSRPGRVLLAIRKDGTPTRDGTMVIDTSSNPVYWVADSHGEEYV